MVETIFQKHNRILKKQLNNATVFSAFGKGIETGRKIDSDLWKLGKKKLQQQLNNAKSKKEKDIVKDVIENKFEDNNDKKQTKRLG